jgi:hypothetical protein
MTLLASDVVTGMMRGQEERMCMRILAPTLVATILTVGLLAVPEAHACSCVRSSLEESVARYPTIVEATFVHIEPAADDHGGFPQQRARVVIARVYKNEGAQLLPGDEIEIVLEGCNSAPWETDLSRYARPLIWFLGRRDPDFSSHFCSPRLGGTPEERERLLTALEQRSVRGSRRARRP